MTAGAAVTRPVSVHLAALGADDAAVLEDRISAARLVCFPTDTVYGVGGALTPAVAGALMAAKGRDPGKPLQVVFATLEALEAGVVLAPELRSACRRLLPGPVTLLLPYPAAWGFPPPGEAGEDARGRWSPPAPIPAARRRPRVWTRWTRLCWRAAIWRWTPAR